MLQSTQRFTQNAAVWYSQCSAPNECSGVVQSLQCSKYEQFVDTKGYQLQSYLEYQGSYYLRVTVKRKVHPGVLSYRLLLFGIQTFQFGLHLGGGIIVMLLQHKAFLLRTITMKDLTVIGKVAEYSMICLSLGKNVIRSSNMFLKSCESSLSAFKHKHGRKEGRKRKTVKLRNGVEQPFLRKASRLKA